MAEPADINVDELRRRARRRLVGAVVLALGVAVVVPMLLETEQKPLGDDVSVKIPPVDDSKFVNRLNESRAKDAGKAAPRTGEDAAKAAASGAAAPAEHASKYDTRVPEAPPAATVPVPPAAADASPKAASDAARMAEPASPRAEAPITPPAAPAVTVAPAPASAPAEKTTPPATPAPSAEAKAAPPSANVAASAPKAAPAAHEGFAVQLAAFADDKGANALAGRLKRAGYTAYTEPLKTSKGTLWRVRVGPYGSREAAIAARDKLKSEGQSGIVAAVK
jgi:DedD protein